MKGKPSKSLFDGIWNLPNIITILRTLMIPAFILVFFNGSRFVALGIFLTAGGLDILDGMLARKLNKTTDFGKLFDPLSDKVMVFSVFVCHTVKGTIPWPVSAVYFATEIILIIGAYGAMKKGIVMSSVFIGKFSQVMITLGLTMAFFHPELAVYGFPFDTAVLCAADVLAVISLFIYRAKLHSVEQSHKDRPRT